MTLCRTIARILFQHRWDRETIESIREISWDHTMAIGASPGVKLQDSAVSKFADIVPAEGDVFFPETAKRKGF